MSREDRLDDILILWEDAAKRGQPLTPEEACRSDPNLLPDFLQLLSKLGPIEVVLNGDAASASPDDLIGRIQAGRFTPLGYHAAGGLGLVFYADDTELKRTVALKYMQTLSYLDPVSRQRFVTEAEITGKLEHPGIVPVYGLGHDTDGRPYYAMRFIHGATLGKDIDKLHTIRDEAKRNVEFRRLLSSFVSVCQTIAYAHVRGVIHRDIKPDNIMLGPYGETLVVDWGLAKRYELPEPDDTVDPGYKLVELTAAPVGQTVYGRAKGSPAYMAPEQADGAWDRVGPHSDIYSLGATLYVLLTGQRPYTGKSSDEVIQAVKAGHLQRPRRHNSDIPRALEAICLKAMAAKPEARYATAKELAEDVDRWMAGEPVAAYPEPLPMRAKRWVKRHQAMVSTSVGVVFVAAALLTVLGLVLSAKNQELSQANSDLFSAKTNLANSNAELKDEKEKLEIAYTAEEREFAAAEAAFRGVMEDLFARATMNQDTATIQLRDAAARRYEEYLIQYVGRNRNRPERRIGVAFALLKVGDIRVLTGTAESALATYGEALEAFEQLDREMPDHRGVRFGLACVYGRRGVMLNDASRLSEAKPALRKARDLFEELTRDSSPIPETRYSSSSGGLYLDSPALRLADVTLALSVQFRAEQLKTQAKGVTAEAEVAREVARLVDWLRAADRALEPGMDLSGNVSVVNRAKSLSLKLQLADLSAEAVSVHEVNTLLTELLLLRDRYPLYAVLQEETLAAELWLADAARKSGKLEDAERLAVDVINRTEKFANAKPGEVPTALRIGSILPRAEAWHQRSFVAEGRNDLIQARKDRRTAQSILGTLVDQDRLDFDTVLNAVFLYIRLAASATRDVVARSDAETCYKAALRLYERLPADAASADSLSAIRVVLLGALANTQATQKKSVDVALAKAEEAIRDHDRITPGDPFLVYMRSNIHLTRALVHINSNNPDAAIVECEATIRLLQDAYKIDKDPGYLFILSTAECTMAGCLAMSVELRRKSNPFGDPDSLALLQRARGLLTKKKTLQFDNPELQRIVEHTNKQWIGMPEMLDLLEAQVKCAVQAGKAAQSVRALLGQFGS